MVCHLIRCILNFPESTTILNACSKKSGNLLNAPHTLILKLQEHEWYHKSPNNTYKVNQYSPSLSLCPYIYIYIYILELERIIHIKVINNCDCDKKHLELGRWTITLVKIIRSDNCDKKQWELGRWRIILIKIIKNDNYDKKLLKLGRWRIILVKFINNNDW